MAFICLPKEERSAVETALKKGELDLAALYRADSPTRRAQFARYMSAENAAVINQRFEAAMISKQKDALKKWVVRTTSKKDPSRRDLNSRIERHGELINPDRADSFLQDLTNQKLGIQVTEEETRTLLSMHKTLKELETKVKPTEPNGSPNRLAYGLARREMQKYVTSIKEAGQPLFSHPRQWRAWPGELLMSAGVFKALNATFDNSFVGRQGIKMLLRGEVKLWAKTAATSFKIFGSDLATKGPGIFKKRDSAALDMIYADLFSRQNAMNGKYYASKNKYFLDIDKEEAFPSAQPERIPVLGRLFRASESAYAGAALKMRADFADLLIDQAEKNGIDMLDQNQATSFGKLVGSMTGRSGLGRLEPVGDVLNIYLFSPRFLASNFNTITGHLFDQTITPQARKVAAKNTLRVAAGLATVLTVAKTLDPDSVTFDTRSSNFGKICKGKRCFDISGGMGGLITLGSRIIPTKHNDEWGFWRKDKYGNLEKMRGDYGEYTPLDTFVDFWLNKSSPSAGVFRDVWNGQNFSGDKPGVVNTTIGLITPISAQNLFEEVQKGSDDILMVMLAEALGFSPSTNGFYGTGTRWQELKKQVDGVEFQETLQQATDNFKELLEKNTKTYRWKNLTNEEREKEVQKLRRQANNNALKRYGL